MRVSTRVGQRPHVPCPLLTRCRGEELGGEGRGASGLSEGWPLLWEGRPESHSQGQLCPQVASLCPLGILPGLTSPRLEFSPCRDSFEADTGPTPSRKHSKSTDTAGTMAGKSRSPVALEGPLEAPEGPAWAGRSGVS